MNFKFPYFMLVMGVVLAGCESGPKPAKGSLEISFTFDKPQDIEPSYCAAIWLEDMNGQYVRSLFVTEYLSYGGYNDSTICPEWSTGADWDNVTDDEFDTVTQATPPVGSHTLTFACEDHHLMTGQYKYFVQTHVIEELNVLYSGVIELGKENSDRAEMERISAHLNVSPNTLSNVSAKYVP